MRIRIFLLFCCSFLLLGADRFSQTTANPDTKILRLFLRGQLLEINLDNSEIAIEKYADGTLRQLTVPIVEDIYQIHFYHQKPKLQEKVAIIRRYQKIQEVLLLQGISEHYDEEGHLLAETSWEEGKLNGKQRVYNADFLVIEEREYSRGFPINQWNVYYPTGKKAYTLEFPPSLDVWATTRLESNNLDQSSLLTMDYFHPFRGKETCYYSNGKKNKERLLEMSESGSSYTIRLVGAETIYDLKGKVIEKRELITGSNCEKVEFSTAGSVFYRERLFFNQLLFKESRFVTP